MWLLWSNGTLDFKDRQSAMTVKHFLLGCVSPSPCFPVFLLVSLVSQSGTFSLFPSQVGPVSVWHPLGRRHV